MISMYHVVDGELVLTHYCAMANQPRARFTTPGRCTRAARKRARTCSFSPARS